MKIKEIKKLTLTNLETCVSTIIGTQQATQQITIRCSECVKKIIS